jgi:hypothetical protein
MFPKIFGGQKLFSYVTGDIDSKGVREWCKHTLYQA